VNRFLQNRLLLQLLFTSIAAISVATLSVILIVEAVRSAESVVLKETDQILLTATSELRQQYLYRVASDSTWQSLPLPAKNVSLRAITQTVLRSYPGVEGGFYAQSDFLGYAFPTHDSADAKTDVPSAERNWIEGIARRSLATGSPAQQVFRGRSDIIVIAAIADKTHPLSVWAMKRLAGRNDPGGEKRRLLLIALISAALLSIVGTLTTGISLQRGVGQVNEGLSRLEKDFKFRLPSRSDELGRVIQSINRMAVVRGQLETELRREDRLRAVGRLASSLAHEIRNPLNSIRLTVQLLEQRLKTNSVRPQDLAIVKGEVDRLNTLVTDLLDLQRTRPPHPEWQPVLPVVEHCLQLLHKQAEGQGHILELQSTQPDLRAYFDSQQLTQALVNLLLNAIQATPAHGRIQVCVGAENGKVEVIVQDGGPGLSDEQLEHLFEPFYTTKPGGTGLGLAISRELMRSQEGDIVYRTHETGARFVIQLSKESPCRAQPF
jgi:signal transduction histidine kinase